VFSSPHPDSIPHPLSFVPVDWGAHSNQTMSPSVGLSSSSGRSRVELDKPNSKFLTSVLNGHSSSYLPKLDPVFGCVCCGQILPTVDDLVQHYEEAHPQQTPQSPRTTSAAARGRENSTLNSKPATAIQLQAQQQQNQQAQKPREQGLQMPQGEAAVRSTSHVATTQATRQGTSGATKRTNPIAMEDQAPNVDILQPSIDSASKLSKKRKRPTSKDPVKFKHECETCGERFTRSTTLREHKRTHNGERPFPCSICSKQFARSKDKIRHEELHTGIKQFYCDLSQSATHGACGQGFAREDGLMAHLRTERGWKCLRIVMDDPRTTIGFAATFIDNKYDCNLTRLACRANFHRLKDLKEHLEDPANRQFATEWLVQNFMYCIRETREEQAETDGRSATRSAAEKQNSSSSGQRRPQPQQTISPPPQPSLEDIRPRQNTTQEQVADVEALAEVISPGNELTVEDRSKHKEAMMAINESRSVWSPDLLLAREAHSDFDPFAGWVLVDCGVEPIRYASFPRNTVWVQMKSPRHLTAEYRMRIGRRTCGVEHQTWKDLPSGGYSLRLQLVASEIALEENLPVSVIYGSGLSPKRTFRVGALRYDFMERGWRISVDPPGQKIGGHWYESPEEMPTDIEHPPTSTAAGEPTVDGGQEGVKLRNDKFALRPLRWLDFVFRLQQLDLQLLLDRYKMPQATHWELVF